MKRASSPPITATAGVVFSLLALSSCGEDAQEATMAISSSSPAAQKEIIAHVDKRPIFLSDLRRQMIQTKQDAHQALDDLIALDLLAEEARRRGYDRDPSVIDIVRRQTATTFIETTFGKNVTKENIPREMVERSFKLNIRRYQRPATVEVKHLICKATRHDTPAVKAGAARCVKEAQQYLSASHISEKDFDRLPERLRDIAAPAQVKTESLTTPRRGFTVAAFADAAFALKKHGDISPPVRTRFGIHFIYLIKHHPARHQTLADVEDAIRDQIFKEAWEILFQRWIKKLEKTRHVKINAAALMKVLDAPRTKPRGHNGSGRKS